MVSVKNLHNDLRLLLVSFIQRSDIHFSAFLEAWKELDFAFIHFAGVDAIEKSEMVEDMFAYIIHVFQTNSMFNVRAWSIYSLYSIYVTQLCDPKVCFCTLYSL